jgi:diguanylate cyclase (GGDEF)-like protein
MEELTNAGFAEDKGIGAQDDLRQRISAVVMDRAELVTADSVATFPHTGIETLDAAYCMRVGRLIVQLLAFGLRDGRMDARGGVVGDLYRVALERLLPGERLFTMTYLTERTCLDDLATDQSLGATTEVWPLVAQLVRRASFDLLAAYTERAQLEAAGAAITDHLTTLYTRPVLDAVLTKALERASRFGDTVSLILFDVDRLAAINKAHGYGVGDRILERLGILVRGYFRQYDWVARHSEDSVVVVLTRTDPDNAMELAERMCLTVAERLEFIDHRTDQRVKVTLSAAVINTGGTIGDVIDSERLMADAEAAVARAKQAGRNRVERVDGYSGSR